jgi:predicted secreted hydrolase
VDLSLDEGRPPTINGRNGISRKGAHDGNASHYYSLTRMPTRGTIVDRRRAYRRDGLSWMDREFGTRFLEPDQQGWDWFSMQLAGRQRPDDLRAAPRRRIARRTLERHAHARRRPRRAARRRRLLRHRHRPGSAPPRPAPSYPIGWRIEIPGEQLALTVTTPLADQELNTRPQRA